MHPFQGSGSIPDPDRVRTRTYPVEVASGGELVPGPYVAEKIPVTVDDDYVVIEL